MSTSETVCSFSRKKAWQRSRRKSAKKSLFKWRRLCYSVKDSSCHLITSGDTEQVTEKLDKGLLDFGVICETPDEKKYRYVLFPESDHFGAVFSPDSPLAQKERITADDLAGLPLFTSEQSWENDIRPWAKETFSALHFKDKQGLFISVGSSDRNRWFQIYLSLPQRHLSR